MDGVIIVQDFGNKALPLGRVGAAGVRVVVGKGNPHPPLSPHASSRLGSSTVPLPQKGKAKLRFDLQDLQELQRFLIGQKGGLIANLGFKLQFSKLLPCAFYLTLIPDCGIRVTCNTHCGRAWLCSRLRFFHYFRYFRCFLIAQAGGLSGKTYLLRC